MKTELFDLSPFPSVVSRLADHTVLAPDAAVLIAPERGVRAVARRAVEADETRAQPAGHGE